MIHAEREQGRRSVLYVAEIGSMHKGSLSLAFEMIRVAKASGADVAKFQFGWPTDDKLRYIDPWAGVLADACRHFDIELMASIWSFAGLEAARRVGMRRYKVAYQKRDDAPLLEEMLKDNKQIFVSGGGTSNGLLTPIFCVSQYPTYPADLRMPKSFDWWHGYSDHAHGIGACLLAVARGARYVEKHFTLDKTDLTVRDTPFSATPDEFFEMVRVGREIERVRDVAV